MHTCIWLDVDNSIVLMSARILLFYIVLYLVYSLITSRPMTVLLIVGPKCMLAMSHAAHW